MRHFSPLQLKEYLSSLSENDAGSSKNNTAPLLLDVREPWEFEYCNIEGSVLIPMGELASELDSLEDEISYDREIIMICHHGIRSRQMGYYMEQAGYKNITNLDGGVEQWARDVDKTMKRY
jgi:rhodanese-related sulfurtransferase